LNFVPPSSLTLPPPFELTLPFSTYSPSVSSASSVSSAPSTPSHQCPITIEEVQQALSDFCVLDQNSNQ
jgi:hypothetical protein